MNKLKPDKKMSVMRLMLENKMGQRDIERITGVSRPTIQTIAEEIGYQFPRNGVEIRGLLCICHHCGRYFRRSKSQVTRARLNFCSPECKDWYMRGENHPSWKDGESVRTFNQWVVKQKEYKHWREQVLLRDGNKCVITGRTENLEAHHILPKSSEEFQHHVFDVDNGITICKEVHTFVHQEMSRGKSPTEAIASAREKFGAAEDE